MPAQQSLEHAAHPRVSGPLVLGPIADDRRHDGRLRAERIVLGQPPDLDSAGPCDPPGVGRLVAGQDRQQRRLAAAVAPDHPDPVAVTDAERDAVEDQRWGRTPC